MCGHPDGQRSCRQNSDLRQLCNLQCDVLMSIPTAAMLQRRMLLISGRMLYAYCCMPAVPQLQRACNMMGCVV